MEYKLKVEYTGTQRDGQKGVSFMVLASNVNFGQYLFASLIHDIKSGFPKAGSILILTM